MKIFDYLYRLQKEKKFKGDFELDESYFGAKRIRGKRGRGAADGLILNRYEHYRIFHWQNEFARGKNRVNEIESFWAFTKRRLAKFNGLTDDKFISHLKES